MPYLWYNVGKRSERETELLKTYGYNADTVEGRRVLQNLGGGMKFNKDALNTEYTIDSVRLRIPSDKETDGRIKRPYLDAKVSVSGLGVENDGFDEVAFDSDHQINAKYRYQLSNDELARLIDLGMYSDVNFEDRLESRLKGQTFVERTPLSVYSTKVQYQGQPVPFVVLADIDLLKTNDVINREHDGRDDFSVMLNERLVNFESAVVSRETQVERQLDLDYEGFVIPSESQVESLESQRDDFEDAFGFEPEPETVNETPIDVEPEEPDVDYEAFDVNEAFLDADNEVEPEPEPYRPQMKTLAEAKAEIEAEARAEKGLEKSELEDDFGDDVFGL